MTRAALVMAGTSGLGRGSAEALARSGHRVAICARRADRVDETVAALQALGSDAIGVVADVSKAGDIERLFAATDEHFGRLDVLVTNAGGPAPGGLLGLSDELWSAAFELTLMSAVRAIRSAIPRMQREGFGRIVVLGSSSVRQPIENLVLSNAFRPAVLGLVKSVATEVAPLGITVNMVSPGRVDTERVRQLDEGRAKAAGLTYAELRASAEKGIPAGRYGTPAEVGALVAFLASEPAAYLTGQSILVDGGMVRAL